MKHLREIPIWFAIFGLILTASGCSFQETPAFFTKVPPSPTASPPLRTTREETETPTTPSTEPAPLPTPVPLERPQYSLEVEFDYQNQQLFVEESILIPHPAINQLDEIDLVVMPNNWPDVFSIQHISAGDLPVIDFEISGITLNIEFGSPGWLPGENLELDIQYSLDLPKLSAPNEYAPSPFGYTTLQTNLVDWYPSVPPFQDDLGWIIHEPWEFGEYLVYPAADFTVSLELGTPGLIVAASSAPLESGDPLIYSQEGARNFVFSISHAYTVLEEEVNGTTIYGYTFPGYQVSGQAVFEATREALVLFSELFGPYDQSSISVVQADFNYGIEYEGLYYQGGGYFDTYNESEQSFLVVIAVHETAHQWWYGKVANDQALEPWLDEALCTFSELAYYEHLYPGSIDWWWRTRVNYYDPSGQIDRTIYDFQEFPNPYLTYRNATYLQGAKFVDAIKNELGDDRFYTFLREYAARFQDQIVSTEDFFSLLGEYLDIGTAAWLGDFFTIE